MASFSTAMLNFDIAIKGFDPSETITHLTRGQWDDLKQL